MQSRSLIRARSTRSYGRPGTAAGRRLLRPRDRGRTPRSRRGPLRPAAPSASGDACHTTIQVGRNEVVIGRDRGFNRIGPSRAVIRRSGQADFLVGRLPRTTRPVSCPYVALMSHGTAGDLCNSLKQDGNSCDTVRHRTGAQKSQKPLILLAVPAGLEPATRGVEIRYSIQLSYGTVLPTGSLSAYIALPI